MSNDFVGFWLTFADHADTLHSGRCTMNEKQRELIKTVMDMIDGSCEIYERDPHYAPPPWILENWWHTLNAVLQSCDVTSSDPSEEP